MDATGQKLRTDGALAQLAKKVSVVALVANESLLQGWGCPNGC